MTDPFALRRLLPLILLCTGAASVFLRLLPTDFVSFRAWEAVTMFVTGQGPFAVNKHYNNPRATGDLPGIGNLPQYREPHPETFTTSALGFRIYDPQRDSPPAALLFGDSFGAGAGLSDAESLGAQLSRQRGAPVFFASHFKKSTLENLAALPRTPVAIIELSERMEGDEAAGIEEAVKKHLTRNSRAYLGLRYLRDLWAYSPLSIWCARAYKELQNDTILPNIYADNVRTYQLTNGATMLFLGSEVAHYLMLPQPSIDAVMLWKKALDRHTCMFVILVPDKFEVYYPLLRKPPGPPPRTLYLDSLENELRAAGVPVLNLSPALRAAAASAIRDNDYVYHLDDTHWNGHGVTVAVKELGAALPSACPSPW